jgi:hypothetical protein
MKNYLHRSHQTSVNRGCHDFSTSHKLLVALKASSITLEPRNLPFPRRARIG